MKPRKFTFHFNGGKITVHALNEQNAKILAQAEAIKKGWDYEVQEPKMTKAQAKQYLQNVLDTWSAFCEGHSQFVLAIQAILREDEEV